jgi:hypothetical protein
MAGLSTDRLKALGEMIKREKKYQSKWFTVPDGYRQEQVQLNSSPVHTSVEYIGTNPDPCRYHLDYLERIHEEKKIPEFQKRIELAQRLALTKGEGPVKTRPANPETSAQHVGWKICEREIPGGMITQKDISAPSVRGTLHRDMYCANWSGPG